MLSTSHQGEVIHRLRAEDGDFGAPRNISFVSDPQSDWATFFRIDPHTGDLILLRDAKDLVERSCGVSLSILKVTVRFAGGGGGLPENIHTNNIMNDNNNNQLYEGTRNREHARVSGS